MGIQDLVAFGCQGPSLSRWHRPQTWFFVTVTLWEKVWPVNLNNALSLCLLLIRPNVRHLGQGQRKNSILAQNCPAQWAHGTHLCCLRSWRPGALLGGGTCWASLLLELSFFETGYHTGRCFANTPFLLLLSQANFSSP